VSEGEGLVVPVDDRFVRAVLAEAPEAARARRFVFSDDNPVDLPGKPGFGGSAAATVAACLAMDVPLERAAAIHAAVQAAAGGGGGSGVDVFASARGGVRMFPTGTEVACPPIVAVWSGRSAATGPRVACYQAWAGREVFVERSRALVEGFAAQPIEALREAYALLRHMAAEAGVDYDTEAFAWIAALADAHGGAAKPSGAGGGDVAVAMFADPDARAAFVDACAGAGFVPIPVRVSGPVSDQSIRS
jgi:phosphomevalonate kinase